MMRTLTAASLSAALALGLFAQTAHAGLLTAIDQAMKNYANNIVKQGEQAKTDIKNGSITNFYNDAFVNYSKSFYEDGMLGGDAAKDSKAIFDELKKIAFWVPNKIKEVWDKIIDALRTVRDKIGAAGPGWPPPNAGGSPAPKPAPAVSGVLPAGPSASAASGPAHASDIAGGVPMAPSDSEAGVRYSGLGDGFLDRFATQSSFGRKFDVFMNYEHQLNGARGWVATLQNNEKQALAPNLSRVSSEADQLEEIFSRDVAGKSFDDFMNMTSSLNASALQSIRGLLQKVSKRVNMQVLGNANDKEAARKAARLSQLKTKLGL